jgi:hypothetical protein
MCLFTIGLMAALASAAIFCGLMVWKVGSEERRRQPIPGRLSERLRRINQLPAPDRLPAPSNA